MGDEWRTHLVDDIFEKKEGTEPRKVKQMFNYPSLGCENNMLGFLT